VGRGDPRSSAVLHLDRHGIHPRSVSGLPGIVAAPFLHADFTHLILNSLPFIVLGGTVLLSGVRAFWGVTIFVTLAGGFGVWLFAPKFTNHIGASGPHLWLPRLSAGARNLQKSFASILIAGAIAIAYGGLLFGVLPLQAGVSWQSHLFGFLAGVAAARLMASTRP
jgi:membrane associated rhomboid family serine protease